MTNKLFVVLVVVAAVTTTCLASVQPNLCISIFSRSSCCMQRDNNRHDTIISPTHYALWLSGLV